MKGKIAICCLFSVMLMGSVHADPGTKTFTVKPGVIAITKPATGDVVLRLSNISVKWTKTGIMNNSIKIRLFNAAGVKVASIVDSAPNSGSYVIPAGILKNIPLGKYRLRVRTVDGKVWGESGLFSLQEMAMSQGGDNRKLTRVIPVMQPENNAKYPSGKPVTIQWNPNIGNYDKVNIHLYNATGDSMADFIAVGHANSGQAHWIADPKYSWPGTKLYIKVSTPDGKVSGKSGIFSIFEDVPQKKELTVAAQISNKQVSLPHNDHPAEKCLYVQLPKPGRVTGNNEIKSGHFKRGGKKDGCYYQVEYHFTSDLTFDLSALKGKEVLKAELKLTLNEENTLVPVGTWSTNEFCTSRSNLYRGDSLLCSFSVFSQGETQTINLLDSVKSWTINGSGGEYVVTVKGQFDGVFIDNTDSVCLKYFGNPVLVVEYKE